MTIKPEHRRLALVLMVSLLAVAVAWRARQALTPFAVGLVLAYIILPIVNRLEHRLPRDMRYRRGVAVLTVYLAAILVGLTAFVVIVPPVVQQAASLIRSVPQLYQQADGVIARLIEAYQRRLAAHQGASSSDVIVGFIARLTSGQALGALGAKLLAALESAFGAALGAVMNTVSWIVAFLVIPFWLVYVLNDAGRLANGALGLVPASWRPDVQAVTHVIDLVLSGYIRGQLVIAVTLGTMASLAMAFLGVPYWLLLGAVTGMLGLIPFLGFILGATLSFVVALTVSPSLAVKALLAYVLIQQIDNFMVTPRVQGHSVRLHPAVIMVVLVVAQALIGPIGLLVAAPVTAILRDVVNYAYLRLGVDPPDPETAVELMGYVSAEAA